MGQENPKSSCELATQIVLFVTLLKLFFICLGDLVCSMCPIFL